MRLVSIVNKMEKRWKRSSAVLDTRNNHRASQYLNKLLSLGGGGSGKSKSGGGNKSGSPDWTLSDSFIKAPVVVVPPNEEQQRPRPKQRPFSISGPIMLLERDRYNKQRRPNYVCQKFASSTNA